MQGIPQSAPLSILLVVLALVFAVLTVLYALGDIQFLVSDPHASHHYTHAFLFAVLTLGSLVAANLTRPRAA
jgi:hypothetical protein